VVSVSSVTYYGYIVTRSRWIVNYILHIFPKPSIPIGYSRFSLWSFYFLLCFFHNDYTAGRSHPAAVHVNMAILSLHYFSIILLTTCSLTFLSKKPSSVSMSIIRSPIETFNCSLTSFGRVICYFGNTLLTSNIKRQPPYLYFKKAKQKKVFSCNRKRLEKTLFL
jgi:hypothetical protein